MRNYYAHLGDNQEGPFSIDELKLKTITKETMVWFEGLEEWIAASKVEELNDLFKSIPPPISKNNVNILPPKIKVKENTLIEPKISYSATLPDEKKKNFTVYWVIGGVAVLMFFLIYKFAMTSMDTDIKQGEQTLQLQEQVIKQDEKIKQQEQIEADRKAKAIKEKKQAEQQQKASELENFRYEYDNAITTLRAENVKLEKLKEFVLLRSSSEREEQIQSQLETIRTWENEVERLKAEIAKY